VAVQFVKAGILAAGDQPELYIFRLGHEDAVVAISGDALARSQRRRRYLSREEKIDVAGLFLQQRIAAGAELVARNLAIGGADLEALAGQLRIDW
jgi:hypothetical protein